MAKPKRCKNCNRVRPLDKWGLCRDNKDICNVVFDVRRGLPPIKGNGSRQPGLPPGPITALPCAPMGTPWRMGGPGGVYDMTGCGADGYQRL